MGGHRVHGWSTSGGGPCSCNQLSNRLGACGRSLSSMTITICAPCGKALRVGEDDVQQERLTVDAACAFRGLSIRVAIGHPPSGEHLPCAVPWIAWRDMNWLRWLGQYRFSCQPAGLDGGLCIHTNSPDASAQPWAVSSTSRIGRARSRTCCRSRMGCWRGKRQGGVSAGTHRYTVPGLIAGAIGKACRRLPISARHQRLHAPPFPSEGRTLVRLRAHERQGEHRVGASGLGKASNRSHSFRHRCHGRTARSVHPPCGRQCSCAASTSGYASRCRVARCDW
jgi:hypothetical protein